jgi:lipoprotein-releasing system ATP-binding protein
LLDGEPLSKLPVDARATLRRGRIGFIFQSHNLMPEFSALENVSIPLWIAGVEPDEAARRSLDALESVGLGGRVGHLPAQLSGGEQQRVSIARALVAHPRIILADEPTGNLDVTTAAEIQELLLQKSREEGRLLVVVTHSTELASSMDCLFEMVPGGALTPRQTAPKQ